MDYEVIRSRILGAAKTSSIVFIVVCLFILEICNLMNSISRVNQKPEPIMMNISMKGRHEIVTDAKFPFKSPFRLIVAGPSGAGKTEFVKRIIESKQNLVAPPPDKITWHYAVWQPWYPNFAARVEFIEGLPTKVEICKKENHLLILDDMSQFMNKNTSQLFACDSHHRNISIIYLTQNFFQKNGHQRDISLNATHIAFFKNPRDNTQIFNLSRQMFPENPKFLTAAYKDATRKPYSYLLIDLTPEINDRFRVRTYFSW